MKERWPPSDYNWAGSIPPVKHMTLSERYLVRPFWIRKYGRMTKDNIYLLPRISAMWRLARMKRKYNAAHGKPSFGVNN